MNVPETYASVNEAAGYAYVNIAKAGCTAVKTAIAEQAGVPFEVVQWEKPWKVPVSQIPAGLFVFTVVRHPMARLVSCWADYVQNPRVAEVRHNPEFRPLEDMPFPEFTQYVRTAREPNLHYAPQWPQLHVDGKLIVDRIIKLEEIEQRWPELQQEFGLPDLPTDEDGRRPSKHEPWPTYYTDGLRRRAVRYYRSDFRHLGYSSRETIRATREAVS